MHAPAVSRTPAPRWRQRAALIARDIKIAHSVFAMPYALLAAFLARTSSTPIALDLALVAACMVAARTWAMVVNRLADRRFDADNPRTTRRAFASGALDVRDGVVALVASGSLFVALTSLFWFFRANPWPIALALPVLGWIAFYSFTKRFTFLCHLFLGGALAASPLAAAIAVEPGVLIPSPTPAGGSILWIAGMVVFWVAGFDVLYALADLDFDRARGLASIPQRLGWRGALWTSRAFHLASLACLVLAGGSDPRLGPAFAAATGIVACVLVLEHAVVARRGLAGLPLAFFTLNGIVSLVIGAAGIADVLSG